MPKKSTKGNYLELTIRWEDPRLASQIANRWASIFESYVNEVYGKMPATSLENMKVQLEQKRREYQQAEEELRNFLKNNKIKELQTQIKLRELTFNRDLAWETYQTILRKYKETELALQSQEMEVRFVAPALPPTKPVIPKPKLYIAVATLLGLFLGTILAFLVEHLETAKVKES